ncbi:MAG: hypothetical protein NT138_05290 [Planctomycetales bacterium]|nr:hypothetical protein [Planctomycetales bacterium]
MKKSGKILHSFTSLFRNSSTSLKRKTNRKSQHLQLETLETRQLLTVPALSSNAGAPVSIYLDFDGFTAPNQGLLSPTIYLDQNNSLRGVSSFRAFNLDANVGPDSPEEERMIEEIFERVSEDFAPFTVNVTTVVPATGTPTIHVAIGDTGAVTHQSILGQTLNYVFSNPAFAMQGAFTLRPSNPVLVFPTQLQNVTGETVAREVSRGVGYHLGLSDLQPPANSNTSGSTPIMQDPGTGQLRNIWGTGDTVSGFQSDIAVMTGLGNYTNAGFRLRPDDIPGNIAAASPGQNSLQATSQPPATAVRLATGMIGVAAGSGLVDSDFHRLTLRFLPTGTAQVSLQIRGLDLSTHQFLGGQTNATLNPGSNLDIVARLYDSFGQVLVTSNLTPSISGRIDYEIPASTIPSNRIATYYVEITTTAEYGSLGRYTVDGTLQELLGTPVVLAPLTTVDTVTPRFAWTPSLRATSYLLDVTSATTGALVFRKYTTATQYTVNPEDNAVQPRAINSLPQGNYSVRVMAIRGAGGTNNESAWSTSVVFKVDVPLPSKPTIVSPKNVTGESFPTFQWTKGTYDRAYDVQVFKKGTTTRVVYKTNQPTSSYVHFSPLPDGAYTVNVRAYNAANEAGAVSDSVDFSVTSPTLVAPRLTAPIGTSTSTQPRFAWTAVTGATFYKLVVHNLSRGTVQFTQENLPRTKTFFDPPVMPQGNYRVQVWAVSNNIGADGKYIAGPSTGWQSFTLDILPPAAPSVTGPRGLNDSPTITTTNPRFTWTVPARGVKYDLLVNNVTTQVAGVIRENGLTSTSFIARTNMAQGQYRVWVRAHNAANEVGDWSLPFDFNIDEPTPSVPVITAPVLNSLGYVEDANPTFRWTTTTPAAAAYDFTLFNVSLGTTAFTVNDLTTASYAVPAASRLGEYVYRAQVRAKNVSGDVTEWSAPYTIRVNIPDPTTPTTLGPGDTITDTTPTFSWRHSSSSFSYEILIRDLLRNEDISLQVKTFSLDPGGATASYTLPDAKALKPGTYRFWVRAINSLGQTSGWSTSRTFVITVKLDDSLQNSPAENPDQLVASRITPALANRNSVTTKATSADARSEDSQPQEEVVATDFVAVVAPSARDRQTAIPQVPGEESLIDAFMHRIADPSSDADFTFLKS